MAALEPGFKALLPKNPKCPHEDVIWDILDAKITGCTVKVTCDSCRTTVVKTVTY